MQPSERFSSRAHSYARYRPGYPRAAIELLQERCGLRPSAVVADLGSGTGILSALLLASAAQVIGIEPNDAMREMAEAALGAEARFVSAKGTAEATGLAPGSVDLIVAGQAFHWFNVSAARAEALRIIRPGGWGALLWNERPPETNAFLADYEALLLQHAAEYAAITASRANEAAMREYLGGAMELATFPNQQTLDFEGLTGRLMSSSYAPEHGHPQHAPMMAALQSVFERHQQHGEIVFPYLTRVYFGCLRPH
jgi:SAM-dependent methyltransferase